MSTNLISSRPPSQSSGTSTETSRRLVSLDALRGFDMFWIVGGEEVVHAIATASPNAVTKFLKEQFTHKQWNGVSFYDLIFPLFVFIVGVSLVFSLTKMMERSGKAAACKRVVIRAVLLYLIGIIYYGGFSKTVGDIRLLGVLQRIALCYLFGGLLFCAFRLRGLIVACVALLVGYWAMMTFIPVPQVGSGNFAEHTNLANYIDKQYLPLRKWDKDYDPEGLLSTLPAIGTCMLGIFAGLLLRNPKLTDQRKVFWLLGAGVAGVVLGFLWGLQFPVIKKLWTSSYVLVAAGYSCLFLAAFYQIIEIWKVQRWAQPFVWIGMNPITLYVAWQFFPFRELAMRLVGGPVQARFGSFGGVLITTVALALVLLLAWFLNRRKIFLRL